MRIPRLVDRVRPTLVVLALLLITLLVVSLTTIAIAGDMEGSEPIIVTAMATELWTGNGGENNCDYGGSFHWILSAGGGGADFNYVSGTLHVVYDRGEPNYTDTIGVISANGAMHFDVDDAPGRVVSASATYEFEGVPGNLVLTISHSACATTTTETPTTETPTTETPTTETPTTETPTTETPTTETPTTETPPTSETPTDSTVVSPETTVPSSESTSTSSTSTAGYPLTSTPTPSQIQTGGGGTAGSSAGALLLGVLAAALSIGLSASAVRGRLRANR